MKKALNILGSNVRSRALSVNKQTTTGLALLLILPIAHASDFYVSPAGNDTNPGTIEQPFATIQKAADVMSAGDTCYIRGGTYRETVTPPTSGTAESPVRFQAYSNETVTVTGLDAVSGWSLHANGIYKAPLPTASQVFADGILMREARWPNTGPNYFSPTYSRADSANVGANGAVSTLTDAPLANFSNGFWTGAKMWYLGDAEWGAGSTTITDHTGNQLTFGNTSPNTSLNIVKGSKYYLYGTLNALDAENEWFHDGSQLYFKAPGSVDPDTLAVEARTRRYGFNLGTRNYIEVAGISLFAATVKMEGSHCLVDDCRILYPTPYFDQKIWQGDDGVELEGSYNTIQRCEIGYSWGDGVSTPSGSVSNTIENCLIHNCNWNAGWSAPIWTRGDSHTITRNRIFNSGRSGVRFYGLTRMILTHNHISDVGWLTRDLGVVKTGGLDSLGSVIAYNWLHDHHSEAYVSGIYLDTGDCENYSIHHNAVWNLDNAIRMNRDCRHNEVYNNTLYSSSNEDMAHFAPLGEVYTDIRTYNNVGTAGPFRGTDLQKNLKDSAANLRFAGGAHGDFRLLEGSSAIDYGRIIAGYTDGYAGSAPDAGAYEFGGADWVAGTDWTPDWNALPVPAFSYLSGSFDASASSDADGFIMRYDWDFGDGSTGMGKTVDHAYASEGTYTVVLTVRDDLSGIVQLTQSVTVTAPPATVIFDNGVDLFMKSDGTKYNTNTLLAGKPVTGTNPADARRAFLQFDLSAMPDTPIATAILRLYHVEGASDDWGTAQIYPVTSGWNADSVSFNQPVGTSLGTIVQNTGPFGAYVELDVTALVREWQASPASNYGFSIRGAESNGNTAKYFSSFEAANTPQLKVTFVALETYASWASGHGLTGANAHTTADAENGGIGDGYTNLQEFALGMDPTIWDAGSRESHGVVEEGGVSYFEYMFHRRTDYLAHGLSYDVLDSTTLLDFGDSVNAQDEVSVGPAVDEYEPVFNRYLLDVQARFLQLRIQQN